MKLNLQMTNNKEKKSNTIIMEIKNMKLNLQMTNNKEKESDTIRMEI